MVSLMLNYQYSCQHSKDFLQHCLSTNLILEELSWIFFLIHDSRHLVCYVSYDLSDVTTATLHACSLRSKIFTLAISEVSSFFPTWTLKYLATNF